MSDIPSMRKAAYDKPERIPLAGQLNDVYRILDDDLDNGELAYRNLKRAKDVGRKTLQAFDDAMMTWMVYAELTQAVRIEREGVLEARLVNQGPTNLYGEVNDISIVDDIDGRRVLAATVESEAIGQYERYIVPLAREGDTRIFKNRPVDMPGLVRNVYQERFSKAEIEIARDFADTLRAGPLPGDHLEDYIRTQTNRNKKAGFERYMVALNLEIEDAYARDEPYSVVVHEGVIAVSYDHSFEASVPHYQYPEDEQFQLLGIQCVRDHDRRQLHEINLFVESHERDRLATIPLDSASVMLWSGAPDDEDESI